MCSFGGGSEHLLSLQMSTVQPGSGSLWSLVEDQVNFVIIALPEKISYFLQHRFHYHWRIYSRSSPLVMIEMFPSLHIFVSPK